MKSLFVKRLISLITVSSLALSALVGCGSNSADSTASVATVENSSEAEAASDDSSESSESASEAAETEAVAIDKEAFDALIASGPVADDADIEANEWASSVKAAGKLKVGAVLTSFLFSQLDETDNAVRGFDAGLYELLTRYILGDESLYEVTQVDSSTRESVLQNNQVDAVFATYSITDERKKLISFAGPYYTSRQAVLVKKGNTDVTGVDSLAGKIVATQAGSTGPDILAEYAPDAQVQDCS